MSCRVNIALKFEFILIVGNKIIKTAEGNNNNNKKVNIETDGIEGI